MGWRTTAFQLTGRDCGNRGRRFDEQLRQLQTASAGEALAEGTAPVGPPPVQQPGVPLLIGGTTDASVRRAVEFGRLLHADGTGGRKMIAGSTLRSPEAVSSASQAYADVGVDELMLDPTVPHPEQVDRLADVVL